MAEKLKIIPLGGLDEIGKNCTVLEYGKDMIVIDCGVGFPDEDMYGVEDVCLSTLALVGSDGVHTKIISPLTSEETEKMQASAQKLKEIIDGLEI